MNDKVKFERKIYPQGDSAATTIPKELINFLELNKGDKILMMGDKSKHGKFVCFWKKGEEE